MEVLPSMPLEIPRTATELTVAAAVRGGRRLAARDLLEPGIAAATPRRETASRVPCVIPRLSVATARVVQALRLRGVRPLQVPTVGALQLVGVGRSPSCGPQLNTATDAPVRPAPAISRARQRATGLEEIGVIPEAITFLPRA